MTKYHKYGVIISRLTILLGGWLDHLGACIGEKLRDLDGKLEKGRPLRGRSNTMWLRAALDWSFCLGNEHFGQLDRLEWLSDAQ